MSEQEREQVFLEQVKKSLDEECEALDAKTLAQLARARRQAIGSSGAKAMPLWRWLRFPAAAILTASLLFFVATFYVNKPDSPPAFTRLDDIEILIAADPPEFYADLDFYLWLAEEEDNAG